MRAEKNVTTSRRSSGLVLTEILVASAILALLSAGIFALVRNGASLATRATEDQMASLIAARVMDRIQAYDCRTLARRAKTEAPIDLSEFAIATRPDAAKGRGLVIGNSRYDGRFRVDFASPRLLRLLITISWRGLKASTPAQIRVMRYVPISKDF
jgi:type II secretory pathway component PulJ